IATTNGRLGRKPGASSHGTVQRWHVTGGAMPNATLIWRNHLASMLFGSRWNGAGSNPRKGNGAARRWSGIVRCSKDFVRAASVRLLRSEERRVGKECRARTERYYDKKTRRQWK